MLNSDWVTVNSVRVVDSVRDMKRNQYFPKFKAVFLKL